MKRLCFLVSLLLLLLGCVGSVAAASYTPLGDTAVGTTVLLNVDGVATEFIVVHQGNPDTSIYDASCDGTWLLMKNIHEQRTWSDWDSNYADSSVHSYLNTSFLGLFDVGTQSVIKSVKIPYCAAWDTWTDTETMAYGSNGVSCKIFLLSAYELGWVFDDFSYLPYVGDGVKLDYFPYGTHITTASVRYSSWNGSSTWPYWTRSTKGVVSGGAVAASGSSPTTYSRNTSSGVRPALIMPSTLYIDSNGYVTELPSYTVTFKDWNGTTLKTQTVNYDSAAVAPSNPSRIGYTFAGWDKSFSNVTSDLTVTAKYSINSYTVTFKDWDGSTLKIETVTYGSAAVAPSDPVRENYMFTGWNKSFSSITSNLTVTAKYVLIIPTDMSFVNEPYVEYRVGGTLDLNALLLSVALNDGSVRTISGADCSVVLTKLSG